MKPPGVLKFGGSSFRDVSAYAEVAAHLQARMKDEERRLVIIVSAMPGGTERLRHRLHQVNEHPLDETIAGLLTLADTVSAHLLASALHRLGTTATVLAGHQTGFVTNTVFSWARLERLDAVPLRNALAAYEVVIIPGGQAADAAGRPTWLGKNSSDLAAVAAAAALGVPEVEIHSDVDGIYSADPHLIAGSRLLPRVSYASAMALSLRGAKVLHRRAIQLAEKHGIKIVCRLNRPPHRIGTVIAATGDLVEAVILNADSITIRFDSAMEADHAHSVFATEGVATLRSDHEIGALVTVVGGFLDLEAFSHRHGIGGVALSEVLVAEISGSRTSLHLVDGWDAAVALAQHLHDPSARSRSHQ